MSFPTWAKWITSFPNRQKVNPFSTATFRLFFSKYALDGYSFNFSIFVYPPSFRQVSPLLLGKTDICLSPTPHFRNKHVKHSSGVTQEQKHFFSLFLREGFGGTPIVKNKERILPRINRLESHLLFQNVFPSSYNPSNSGRSAALEIREKKRGDLCFAVFGGGIHETLFFSGTVSGAHQL